MSTKSESLSRRQALKLLAGVGVVATSGCSSAPSESSGAKAQAAQPSAARATRNPILARAPLGTHWPTRDPFLFCAHHDDRYPAGNPQLGPAAPLVGRNLGQDFAGKDGWNMYHGRVVPGFPRHPHRGFETVTVVRSGLLDHSDSLGAAARYGGGDVQWLTAGDGILHAEMFPLLRAERDNPLELFQIWLNLPSESKRVAPHFSMLWNERIPRLREKDAQGRETEITVIAGSHGGKQALSPPPNSWAARSEADVAIWSIRMEAGAHWTLPPAKLGTNRSLYVFRGGGLTLAGHPLGVKQQADLRGELAVALANGPTETDMLLLQGRPIGEPVARHGPFVMNTADEIRQAYADYRRTQFGGWPWQGDDPVHGREPGRFARYIDGRTERPA